MSNYVLTDVWKNSQSTGAARLVLLSLADQANDDGESWPKIEQIADRCRVSRRSVFRHLETLVELGELTIENRAIEGRPSLYRVHVPRCQSGTPPVSDWHHPGANGGTPPVSAVAPQEPSVEPSTTHSSADADQRADDDPISAVFSEFWKLYPRTRGGVSKAAARKAFVRESRRAATDDILAGVRIFADQCAANRVEERFIAHPVTWLNQQRWETLLPANGDDTRTDDEKVADLRRRNTMAWWNN